MGRKCSVVGCCSNVGLHQFPLDLEMRRRWLRVVGREENTELPHRAGVCKQHFTRDSYANFMEFEMGYSKILHLKSEAVPNLALPRLSQSSPTLLLPRHHRGGFERQIQSVPKSTREIGCQTERVINKHAFVQANLKPYRRSKAIQARAPSRSVSCDTGTLTESPLPESPRASCTTLKRKGCEVSPLDPSCNLDASSVNSTRCPSAQGELQFQLGATTDPHIKEEDEEADVGKIPLTVVEVKRKGDKDGLPESSQLYHHSPSEGLPPDNLLAPLSDSDDMEEPLECDTYSGDDEKQ
ncbi:uncharacterized protein LOC144048590 [Vanacampus margaritifer]